MKKSGIAPSSRGSVDGDVVVAVVVVVVGVVEVVVAMVDVVFEVDVVEVVVLVVGFELVEFPPPAELVV